VKGFISKLEDIIPAVLLKFPDTAGFRIRSTSNVETEKLR
jgi:hypothetical protein